jgi:hypothetical protein
VAGEDGAAPASAPETAAPDVDASLRELGEKT